MGFKHDASIHFAVVIEEGNTFLFSVAYDHQANPGHTPRFMFFFCNSISHLVYHFSCYSKLGIDLTLYKGVVNPPCTRIETNISQWASFENSYVVTGKKLLRR